MKSDKAVLMACPWVGRKCQSTKCMGWYCHTGEEGYCQIVACYFPIMTMSAKVPKEPNIPSSST